MFIGYKFNHYSLDEGNSKSADILIRCIKVDIDKKS